MKKLFFFLSLFFTTCFCFSCSKESSVKNNLEGTWGLVHYESYTSVDGVKYSEDIGDCNPFAPTGDRDRMITIINTVDNKYLVNFYSWNKKTSKWAVDSSMKVTWTIKGNKIYVDGDDPVTFKLTTDTFSFEGTSEYEIDGKLLDREGKVKMVDYGYFVFRKMSDLSEQ